MNCFCFRRVSQFQKSDVMLQDFFLMSCQSETAQNTESWICQAPSIVRVSSSVMYWHPPTHPPGDCWPGCCKRNSSRKFSWEYAHCLLSSSPIQAQRTKPRAPKQRSQNRQQLHLQMTPFLITISPIKLQFLNFYLKEKPQSEKQIETRAKGKGLREHMRKPTKSPGSLQSSRLSTT